MEGTQSKSKKQFNYPENWIIYQSQEPDAALLLLHGLGDSAQGWSDVGQLLFKQYPSMRVILPTAPISPVTLNGGMRMTSWYDILGLDPSDTEDSKGIKSSVELIESVIQHQIDSGISSKRIIVAGFSQGGVISLCSGFLHNNKTNPLGGIIGMSCYLGLRKEILPVIETSKKVIPPILMCHGTTDMVVNYAWGNSSYQVLSKLLGDKISFKSYEGMGHSACFEEIKDITTFISQILKTNSIFGANTSTSKGSQNQTPIP